ncbi:MAG: hypothetical protein WA220_09660 [Candidatus Nitrosopolaris sp.]
MGRGKLISARLATATYPAFRLSFHESVKNLKGGTTCEEPIRGLQTPNARATSKLG